MILRSAADREILRRADEIKRAEKSARSARPKAERERRVEHVNVKADRGRVRDNGYLAYLRRQPCVACHRVPPCDPAHIRTHKRGELPTGLGRKPDDRRATSLCRACHDRQHAMRELDFWAGLGLDPFEVAERLFAAYQAEGASNG